MRGSRWFFVAAASASSLVSGCGDDSVRVVQADVWGYGSGNRKTVSVDPNELIEATAIVGQGASAKRIAGRIGKSGVATFEGVSGGSYVVELRYATDPDYPEDLPYVVQFPSDGAKTIRLGDRMWAHPDGELLDDASSFTFQLTDASGFDDGDTLELISLGSYFYGAITFDSLAAEYTNPPTDGATTASGWEVPATEVEALYGADGMHLPSASRGDELTLIHSRSESVDYGATSYDPWRWSRLTRALGVSTMPRTTLANGAPNSVTATLEAPPSSPVTIDFRGSTFAALREQQAYGPYIPSSTRVTVTQEVGDGPGYFASPAPASWSLYSGSRRAPANPDCFPAADGSCGGPDVCPAGCDTTLLQTQIDPADLKRTLTLPRVYASGMRDVLSVTYSFYTTFKHPTVPGTSAMMSATSTLGRPASALSGPIALALPAPTNLVLDGEVIVPGSSPTLAIDSLTPTISFEASAGAEYYRIEVIGLTPDAESEDVTPRTTRTVATLYTRENRIAIPANVLQQGRFYYVRVYATRDGTDFATPYSSASDSIDRTGIFSLPFRLP